MPKFSKVALLALPLAVASSGAFAQAAEFTAELTEATTNVGLMAGGLVALAAVGVGFGIAVKYIKKLRGAA